MTASSITIKLPDDFHHHARDGDRTSTVLKHVAQRFGRCLFMPNLKPPVVNTEMALEYRTHILNNLPSGSQVEPLMTLYLTDNTTAEEIRKAHATGLIVACKYYPAGATTNSDSGVSNVENTYAALEAMEEVGMLLLIHSEVTHGDIFDREPMFIEEVMKPLVAKFPTLKIVMEHISTEEAVNYVLSAPDNIKATITCHHLLLNRNHMLVGGIKPHLYCLPILKAEKHRIALLKAATSGSPKFFAGTDSAPHAIGDKESCCGCAGVYTAHGAVELYAEAFEAEGALEKLDNFLSKFGAEHYGLKRSSKQIVLKKEAWVVPQVYQFGQTVVVPLRAGQEITWKIV